MPKKKEMTFKQCLESLGIPEYSKRIFNSNSRGELFHIADYFELERVYGGNPEFKKNFEKIVKHAENNWKRPESIFQHVLTIIAES